MQAQQKSNVGNSLVQCTLLENAVFRQPQDEQTTSKEHFIEPPSCSGSLGWSEIAVLHSFLVGAK